MKKFELLFFTVAKKCMSTAWHVEQLSLFWQSARTVSSSCHFYVKVFFRVIAIRVVHPHLDGVLMSRILTLKLDTYSSRKSLFFHFFCIEDIYVKTKQWPLAGEFVEFGKFGEFGEFMENNVDHL
jgi:hypothetical protein